MVIKLCLKVYHLKHLLHYDNVARVREGDNGGRHMESKAPNNNIRKSTHMKRENIKLKEFIR